MNSTAFDRHVLARVHADVREHFPNIAPMRDAWTYNFGRDHFEFHGPEKFYWHGRAGSAYDARAKGWCAFLAERGVAGYATNTP